MIPALCRFFNPTPMPFLHFPLHSLNSPILYLFGGKQREEDFAGQGILMADLMQVPSSTAAVFQRKRREVSIMAAAASAFRKGVTAACQTDDGASDAVEISCPTHVRHLNHVTFDRFHGFLGLPAEFELEVPRMPPSASTTVFGVSTESMQMSYDLRGNSVPTILLLMQKHLYSRGGLQAEGIFRVTACNSHEWLVRDQLNRGVIPDEADVHCLAGLIKAWFRELPRGLLDSLSPDEVMQCLSEEDFDVLVHRLPPTEAALLDWAINLMADVVEEEHSNKMNVRNIAVVFAPNMTKMADPLTAIMFAVQVMNFLKTLIEKALRQRKYSGVEPIHSPQMDPSYETMPDFDQTSPSASSDESVDIDSFRTPTAQLHISRGQDEEGSTTGLENIKQVNFRAGILQEEDWRFVAQV